MSQQRLIKPHVTYRRLQKAVEKHVRRAELKPAIDLCDRALADLPKTEYHRARSRSWLSQADEAAKWLAAFYRQASKTMRVKSLYCEMARFEINTDAWDAEAFAYDRFGDPEEPGWLVGWKKSTSKSLVLSGMTDLQRVYARDQAREDGPPPKSIAASEAVSMLLTLRFMELIQAAASQARSSGKLPEDVPVLAAIHDSDLVLVAYGKIQPAVTSPERPRPKRPRPRAGGRQHIYQLDIAWDEFRNSLPYDVLDFVSVNDEFSYGSCLKRAPRLAGDWQPPRMKLRRRKWRCDLLRLGATRCWAVTARAKAILESLLEKMVEFLPLRCADLECWVMHPLRHIELSPKAVHDGHNGSNITQIKNYDFNPRDLRGLHLFGVLNAPGSAARRAGFCYRCNYVSDEFKRLVEEHDLHGGAFEQVCSYKSMEA